MIQDFSTWAKSIVFAVIIVSILEMLLPNNKTKKYVKTVMGLFILYNIISPAIKDKGVFSFEQIDVNSYVSNSINTVEVNQQSMDKRLEELYIEELEKDIKEKIEKQGFDVKTCKVKAKITENKEDTGITKIKLKIEKNEQNREVVEQTEQVENKIVSEIQKIKKVNPNLSLDNTENEKSKIDKTDIQNIKNFLIKEYGVNEKCLEIN